jgi:hypothetical protein
MNLKRGDLVSWREFPITESYSRDGIDFYHVGIVIDINEAHSDMSSFVDTLCLILDEKNKMVWLSENCLFNKNYDHCIQKQKRKSN